MHLETATSALRPITSSDTHAIAEVVFSDPDGQKNSRFLNRISVSLRL